MSKEIGTRLREFGERKFTSVKDFAEALNMKPPSLQQYLKGDREPGTPILIRLLKIGCNITWLLTGRKSDELEAIEKLSDRIKELEYELNEKNKMLLNIQQQLEENKIYTLKVAEKTRNYTSKKK